MLSPSNVLNTSTLKILLNVNSLQINNFTIFIEKKEFTDEIKDVIFNLGYNEIITSDENNNFTSITNQKIVTRKRTRDRLVQEEYFERNNWISPSRIRNFFNDSFEGLLKENPEVMVVKEKHVSNIYFEKGYEFEAFIKNFLSDKYPIIQILKDIPKPDPVKFKETLSMMYSGHPIIYQGLLLDGENRTYGSPDFLIRSDILSKMFPEMKFSFENKKSKIGQYHYVVVDVKFKTLELIGNDFELSSGKKYHGDIAQVMLYQRIINKIQGEFNYCYLLGKRCIKKSKDIKFSGLKYLGEINLNNPKVKSIESESIGYLKEIKDLREHRGRYTFENLPKKYYPNLNYKNTNFPENKEYFKNKYLKEDMKNNFNFSNISDILEEIPNDKLQIYLDFETIDTDLYFSMKEIPENYNSTFISQIGFYIPKLDEYYSFVTKEVTFESEYENLFKFVDYMKKLEKRFNMEVVFVTYGNYEESLWLKLSSYYQELPDYEFIDLLKIFRYYNLKTEGSYSLKTIAKELSHFYPDDFTLNYKNSQVNNGADAMHQMLRYYNSKNQKVKDDILSEVEYYNELDCKMMFEILDFFQENLIKN